jgi:hypothetical protein
LQYFVAISDRLRVRQKTEWGSGYGTRARRLPGLVTIFDGGTLPCSILNDRNGHETALMRDRLVSAFGLPVSRASFLLSLDGDGAQFGSDPSATTEQVERHDVARPRNSDSIQRDQGHRQRLDASHAGIFKEEQCQSSANCHDKICEPDEVED